MNTVIGLRDLRENLKDYEALVKKGRSFVVVKRSKPIFLISPVEADEWETVIDFRKVRKGGVSAKEVLAALRGL